MSPPGEPSVQTALRFSTVNAQGSIAVGSYLIGSGSHLAGHQALVLRNDLDVTVIGSGRVTRRFTIDLTSLLQTLPDAYEDADLKTNRTCH